MSNKAWVFALGCFIFGLAIGAVASYVAATVYYRKVAAQVLLTAEDIRLIQAAQRATAAYWNESPTVGIYELKQYLGTLRQAEKLPDNPRIRRDRTYLSMTLTHGRLA